MPENVTYTGGYLRFIKSKKQIILSDAEITKIVEQIETDRLTPSAKTHQEHVNHVKATVADKKNRCPKCGSELVMKVTKKGPNAGKEFLACRSFPKCRYAISD